MHLILIFLLAWVSPLSGSLEVVTKSTSEALVQAWQFVKAEALPISQLPLHSPNCTDLAAAMVGKVLKQLHEEHPRIDVLKLLSNEEKWVSEFLTQNSMAHLWAPTFNLKSNEEILWFVEDHCVEGQSLIDCLLGIFIELTRDASQVDVSHIKEPIFTEKVLDPYKTELAELGFANSYELFAFSHRYLTTFPGLGSYLDNEQILLGKLFADQRLKKLFAYKEAELRRFWLKNCDGQSYVRCVQLSLEEVALIVKPLGLLSGDRYLLHSYLILLAVLIVATAGVVVVRIFQKWRTLNFYGESRIMAALPSVDAPRASHTSATKVASIEPDLMYVGCQKESWVSFAFRLLWTHLFFWTSQAYLVYHTYTVYMSDPPKAVHNRLMEVAVVVHLMATLICLFWIGFPNLLMDILSLPAPLDEAERVIIKPSSLLPWYHPTFYTHLRKTEVLPVYTIRVPRHPTHNVTLSLVKQSDSSNPQLISIPESVETDPLYNQQRAAEDMEDYRFFNHLGVAFRYVSPAFEPTQWDVMPIKEVIQRIRGGVPQRHTEGHVYNVNKTYLPDVLDEHGNFRKGLSTMEYRRSAMVQGRNVINIELPSTFQYFAIEFSRLNYVRGLIFIWFLFFLRVYLEPAVWLLFTVVFGCSQALTVVKKRWEDIGRYTEQGGTTDKVYVLRSKGWAFVPPSDLVCGDIFQLHQQMTLPVDAILVQGTLIMDESLISGESTPVPKFEAPLDESEMPEELRKGILEGPAAAFAQHHVLFSGTKVSQVTKFVVNNSSLDLPQPAGEDNFQGIASVIGIGGRSTLGRLVRPMLAKEDEYLEVDLGNGAFVYYFSLAVIWLLAFAVMFPVKGYNRIGELVLNLASCCDAYNPGLANGLSVNAAAWSKRLMDQINGARVHSKRGLCAVGRTEICVWDKTGALTAPGMSLVSLRPAIHGNLPMFSDAIKLNQTSSRSQDPVLRRSALIRRFEPQVGVNHRGRGAELADNLIDGLTVCTLLTPVGSTLLGHNIDLAIAETIKPQFSPTFDGMMVTRENRTHRILRQLEFSQKNMTSGVISRLEDSGPVMLYVKGAPDKILPLVKRQTVPYDFLEEVDRLTSKGYYLIALMSRNLSEESEQLLYTKNAKIDALIQLPRSDLEINLNFLGFLVFENKLRDDSLEMIDFLQTGGIHSIICTGDHLRAGVAVARELTLFPMNLNRKGRDPSGHMAMEDAKLVPGEVLLGDVNVANTIVAKNGQNEILWRALSSEVYLSHDHVRENVDKFYFGITGDAFMALLASGDFGLFHQRIRVYGRMRPKDKAHLCHVLKDPEGALPEEREFSFGLPSPLEPISVTTTSSKYGKSVITVKREWEDKDETNVKSKRKTTCWEKVTRSFRKENVVCMIGDGVNDTSAFSSASVGIVVGHDSVPSAAKVAAAFACRTDSLECVKNIFLTGRAAHASALAQFYLYVVFSLVILTFTLCLRMMGSIGALKIFITITVSVSFALNFALAFGQPRSKLDATRLPRHLTNVPVLVRIVTLYACMITSAAVAYFALQQTNFFVPVKSAQLNLQGNEKSHNYESALSYYFVFVSAICLAVAGSLPNGHLRPIFYNYRLMIVILVMFGWLQFLFFGSHTDVHCWANINCDFQTRTQFDALRNNSVVRLPRESSLVRLPKDKYCFFGPQLIHMDSPDEWPADMNYEKEFATMSEEEIVGKFFPPLYKKFYEACRSTDSTPKTLSEFDVELAKFKFPKDYDNKMPTCEPPHNCFSNTYVMTLLGIFGFTLVLSILAMHGLRLIDVAAGLHKRGDRKTRN